MTTKVLIPSGVLGLGFSREALERGLAEKPDIIAIDGGSTDSGPFYLGTGTSKYAHAICMDEWRILMQARARLNIPLVIGSCGTCGTRSTVDEMYDLTCSLAEELGQTLKIARLYSDQAPNELAQTFHAGLIKPLNLAPAITAQDILDCSNIVALAGVEHIAECLNTGADIVLAGRTTDTATIAALPIMRGAHVATSWHGAKIGECGAFCSSNPQSGVILISFDPSGCTVTPMAEDAHCTPHSVSAHMLYENADPYLLHEPGGCLDVSKAQYHALDAQSVRIEGAEWIAAKDYTVKLEGAKCAGYQTLMLAIIRDKHYVQYAKDWQQKLKLYCHDKIRSSMRISNYDLDFRLIGIDAALGALETQQSNPAEVGVMLMITAPDQLTATDIARLINPYLLHFPLSANEDLPTFAFAHSPAHSERGAVYVFALNHVRILDHPMQGFSITVSEVDYG